MDHKARSDPEKPEKVTRAMHREERLKVALKANMAKRKAQVRARSGTATAGMTGPEENKD